MKYLLDTNVLRELGKTSPHKNVAAWLRNVDDTDQRALLPIDRAVAAAWGEALGESEKHVDDVGLAATARVHGLIVVTRNVKDFDGRGVTLLDPFKAKRRSRA